MLPAARLGTFTQRPADLLGAGQRRHGGGVLSGASARTELGNRHDCHDTPAGLRAHFATLPEPERRALVADAATEPPARITSSPAT